MRVWKAAAIAIVTVLMAAGAYSVTDTGCIGSCDGSDGDPPCAEDPDLTCPTFSQMCTDTEDNDSDQSVDGVDDTDLGCVAPYTYDFVEGNVWDGDLTNLLAGGSPSGVFLESLYFETNVRIGNDNSRDSEIDQSSGAAYEDEANGKDVQVTEFYVSEPGTESDRKYGFGYRDSYVLDDLPRGSVKKNGRIIDPPNPDGLTSTINPTTCGDGKENEDYVEDDLSSNPEGDEKGTSSSSVVCPSDYGRILYKDDTGPGIKDPYDDKGEPGMKCRDDEASCTSSSSCSCTASSSCGGPCSVDCDADANVECTVDQDYSSDENNYRWEVDGDEFYRMDCQDDGGWIAEDSASASCSETEYYSVPSGSCDISASCSDSDSASDSDEAGRFRAWEETDRLNCHDEYSVVDGGGDNHGNARYSTQTDYTAGKDPVADNDPAATYTRFTAFFDDTWGGTDPDDGKVWCGYDYTVTVDADGPRGNGDGFAVIHDGSLVATMSPDGSDSVGERIYVDGSDFSSDFSDKSDMIDTSCSGEKTTCVKYIDYRVEPGEADMGNPDWTVNNDDSVPDSIINVYEQEFTLNQGYSVCKLANYINEKNGNGEEIVDCDYEEGTVGSEDISPLPEACGDEVSEHLVVTEGYEVNHDDTQNYLKSSQKCVDWKDDSGWMDESISSSGCVYDGRVFSEGTVLNMKTPSYAVDNGDRFEKGDVSPDREVCLDVDGTGISMDNDLSDDDGEYLPWDNDANDVDNQDFGGEWYDLDNEMMNEYLRNEGDNLIDSGDPNDPFDIAYFYGENPNPYHADYNPTGGEEGVALEDDCGPGVSGCDDTGPNSGGAILDTDGLFYSFFSRLAINGDAGG